MNAQQLRDQGRAEANDIKQNEVRSCPDGTSATVRALYEIAAQIATPEPTGNPHRWVQLQYFEGELLALDVEGTIWRLQRHQDGNFIVSLAVTSPKAY